LEGVSLTLNRATSIAITGRSGSGKSTLLQVSAGLLSADSGSIRFEGKEISKLDDEHLSRLRSRSMGFIFQSSLLLDDFTALENVQISAMIAGYSERDASRKALAMLELVGMQDRLGHTSDHLSGGERQRVAIARALVNEPSLIFADEPTGSLDERNAALVEDLLFSLVAEREVALMLITHNLSFASRCHTVYQLHNGNVEVRS
jgi:lipoprotein-releasing system ATP-binding protein